MDSEARWYFTHETEEDRLWYQMFFTMCKKFDVSWAKASEKEKAFIEEITRFNFETELVRRNGSENKVRGFFDNSAIA